jgi:CheY-like chemotaxis protein
MRVLFVEDSEVNRRVIKEMLRAGDIAMAEAEDGFAGLEAIETGDYDLILMDLRMPGMDGLTAIRQIRARADHKANLPIIVITADDGPTLLADCREAGADDVMHKPVSMNVLFEGIVALMSARGDKTAMLA